MLFVTQADATVDHFYDEFCVIRLNIFTAYIQQYMTLAGELDGIAQKIHNDLSNAAGIPQEMARAIILIMENGFDVFFVGIYRQHLYNVIAQFFHIKGNAFQGHFVGFDFGKIQNVINNVEQQFAGFFNGV